MKLCPTYIVINDDYTHKSTIISTNDKDTLINELITKVTSLKVSFHVTGGYIAGEAETTITHEYDKAI